MEKLRELHMLALDYSQIKYDHRYSAAMDEGQFNNLKTNIGCNYYLYLYNLVKLYKPSNIVELGTSIGRSAMFMMTALQKSSKLTTIEISSFMRTDLTHFIDDSRLTIVYGSDIDPATYDELDLDNIDFLFIDAMHSYEHVNIEWSIYKRFLTNGALVVMDDIHLNDGMSKFWNDLEYDKIDTGKSIHFSGFGIFIFEP